MKMYINRTMENLLNELVDKYPVITITGPRQVGKSTLLEYIAKANKKEVTYITLDDIFLRTAANEDPLLFLRNYNTPLIINEFQYAPNLLNYIKIIVDEARKNALFENGPKETLYYLTGLQIFESMENLSESLAGRIAILDLYGFSTRELNKLEEDAFIPEINEIRKRKRLPNMTTEQLFERIINGSYPELNTNSNINREVFFRSYIRTYIERDIRKLINVKDEAKFLKFISCMAARTSEEYNASDLAKDIEVDPKTIDNWTRILVNTHLIYLLPPYSNNNLKKIIKRPKIYFTDTGLAAFLAGYLDAQTLEKSAFSGSIFETYVITEIIKSFASNGKDIRHRLFYYRDKDKKEIDLLIEYNNIVYPIEIKKSANPSKEAIKNFDVTKEFNKDIGTGIVLCMIREITPIDEHNYFVPIEYL